MFIKYKIELLAKRIFSETSVLSLWAHRLTLYFIIYLAIIGSHLFFKRFDWWHTDVDSARYMLSALIQSEAAIVALVVTLSLVAVQLAAQSYSWRMIEVFRRTPDLWILMGIYGIAIFWGLGVLKMIERANPQLCAKEYICLSNLEGHILGAYYLGVFAFVALVPYIWKTLELLEPLTVIKMLKENITKETILHTVKEDEKDPIQPIIDIASSALARFDYEIVRNGLKAITERANLILEKEKFKNFEAMFISNHIFHHLTTLGKIALSRNEKESATEVIYILQEIGETAANQNLDSVTPASFLKDIGILAAKPKFENVTQAVIISLKKIGIAAVEKKLERSASKAVESLKEVGDETFKQKLTDAMHEVIPSLGQVGKALIKHKKLEKQLEDVLWEVISHLNELKDHAIEQGLEENLIGYLGDIGIDAVDNELENLIWQITIYLRNVQEAVEKPKLENTTKKTLYTLERIGTEAVNHVPTLEIATRQVIVSLGAVGREATKQNINASWRSPVFLKNIGLITIEQQLYDLTNLTKNYLNEIIKVAEEYENEPRLTKQKAEEALREINEKLSAV